MKWSYSIFVVTSLMAAFPVYGQTQAPTTAPTAVPSPIQDVATPMSGTSTNGAPLGAASDNPTIAPSDPKASPEVPIRATTSAGELYVLLGNKGYGEWTHSLFYAPQDAKNLSEILELVAGGHNQEALTRAGGGEKLQDPIDAMMATSPAAADGKPKGQMVYPPEVPIFYLSSIVYNSEDDWSVWLNGTRFSADRPVAPQGGIEVLSVTRDSAKFSWSPIQFSKVQEKFDGAELKATPHDRLPLQDRVTVNAEAKRIDFTLMPNQSFFTLTPSISQGLPFRDPASISQMPSSMRLGKTAAAGTPMRVAKGVQVQPGLNQAPGSAGNMGAEGMPLPLNPTYRDIGGMLERSYLMKH